MITKIIMGIRLSDSVANWICQFINNNSDAIIWDILKWIVGLLFTFLAYLTSYHGFFKRRIRIANIVSRNEKEIIKGYNFIKNDILVDYVKWRLIQKFVTPNFTAYDPYKELTFSELFEMICKKTNENRVMFIYAKAGMGKTLLSRYLAYKLMMKNKDNSSTDDGVFYEQFDHYDSVQDIIDDIKSKKIHYIILDGFDEFRALNSSSIECVLNELISKLSDTENKYDKIIITSRVELFRNGQRHITTIEDIKIKLININIFDKKRIIKTYKRSFYRNRHMISSEAYKISILKKRKFLRKLKYHIKKTGEEKSIFNNPFFTRYAYALLSELSQEDLKTLVYEEAFEKIVDICMSIEYKICKNVRKENNSIYISEKEFKKERFDFLSKITLVIINAVTYKVTNKELDDSGLDYTRYENMRNFLVREEETLRFTHRLFLEYFIALNFQVISYKEKLEILSKETYYNKKSILHFYAYFIETNNCRLSYKKDAFKSSIKRYKDKYDENIAFHYNLDTSYYQLVFAEYLEIKTNTLLLIYKIIEILPVVKTIEIDNAILNYENFSEYIENKNLILYDSKIRFSSVNIDIIDKFGKLTKLNLLSSEIRKYNGLNKIKSLEELKINVYYSQQIDELLSCTNIKYLLINVTGECRYIVDTYKVLKERLSNEIISTKMKLVASIDKEILNAIMKYFVNLVHNFNVNSNIFQSALDNKDIKINEKNIESISLMIDFLNNVYFCEVASNLPESICLGEHFHVYYNARAIIYRNIGKYQEAINDCTKAISFQEDPEYFYLRARGYEKLKRYQEAIDDCTKAISFREDPYYFYVRAGGYHELRKYQEAIDDSTKAISIEEDHKFFYVRACGYHALGKYKEAIADCTKAIELQNNDKEEYENYLMLRAESYFFRKKYQESLKDYTKVIDLYPNNYKAVYLRAMVYNNVKEYQKAVDDYTKIIDLQITHFDNSSIYFKDISHFLNARAKCYTYMKEYQKAIDDFTKAMNLHPNNAAYLAQISIPLYKTDNLNLAFEYLEKAMNLGNRVGVTYKNYAYINLKFAKKNNKNIDESILENLHKALEYQETMTNKIVLNNFPERFLNENNTMKDFLMISECYTYIGEYYLSINNDGEAFINLKKALKLYNLNEYAWYYLHKYHAIKGNNKSSDFCLKKAESLGYIRSDDD